MKPEHWLQQDERGNDRVKIKSFLLRNKKKMEKGGGEMTGDIRSLTAGLNKVVPGVQRVREKEAVQGGPSNLIMPAA